MGSAQGAANVSILDTSVVAIKPIGNSCRILRYTHLLQESNMAKPELPERKTGRHYRVPINKKTCPQPDPCSFSIL